VRLGKNPLLRGLREKVEQLRAGHVVDEEIRLFGLQQGEGLLHEGIPHLASLKDDHTGILLAGLAQEIDPHGRITCR